MPFDPPPFISRPVHLSSRPALVPRFLCAGSRSHQVSYLRSDRGPPSPLRRDELPARRAGRPRVLVSWTISLQDVHVVGTLQKAPPEAYPRAGASVPCRSLGDSWPESSPPIEHESARRQQRRQPEPPLLALRLGPLCLPLVSAPSPVSEPLAAEQQLLPAAGPSGQPAPCSELARLRSLLASREPGLEQRLAATGEPADAAFYARWLKARGGCPEAAAAGVLAHVGWREDLVRCAWADAAAAAGDSGDDSRASLSIGGGGGGIPEAAIQDELAARKVFLQGCDAQGCPVIVVKACRWGPRAAPPRRFLAKRHSEGLARAILPAAPQPLPGQRPTLAACCN